MALQKANGFFTEYTAELRITAGAWEFLQSALTGSSKSMEVSTIVTVGSKDHSFYLLFGTALCFTQYDISVLQPSFIPDII